jgi:hypothetical protein
MDWNLTQDKNKDLLIEEGYYANWEDTTLWKGNILYTNVLFYKALTDFAHLLKHIKNKEHLKYLDLSKKLNKKINSVFWNKEFYSKSPEAKNYISIGANMLAIIYRIANREKAKKIFNSLKKEHLLEEIPMKSSYPRYPTYRTSLLKSKYQNSYGWGWVSCLAIVAMSETGLKKQAREHLKELEDLIVKSRGLAEIYEDKRPVNNFLIKTEQPFAWSSGLFILAKNSV